METVNRAICPIEPILDPSKINLSLLQPVKDKLRNGIETYSFFNDTTQLVKIAFIFRAGTAFQSKAFSAAMTAQLLTEGTSRHTAKEIADFLDFRGAHIEKSVDKESVSIALYTLEKYVYEILPLLKEMLEDSIFPEQELSILLAKRRQQFKIESQKTSFIARNSFNETVFGNTHPYGKIGRIEDFDLVKREDILRHYTTFYLQKPFQVVMAGNITPQLNTLINSCFGQSKKETETPLLDTTHYATKPHDVFLEKKDAVQSTIRIGKISMAPTHPDFAELSVLNAILGGYFGSRLMKNIREEKGYTYGIYSLLQVHRELSVFSVITDVKCEVTKQAIDEIYKEIDILQTHLITDEELELVKNYLTGSFIRSIDGVFELSERYSLLLQNNLSIDFYKRYIHAVENVKSSQLQKLAQQYLSVNSLFEVCAGNKNI